MANEQIQKYENMVNLQMAAEAFWEDWNRLDKEFLDIAKDGNNVNSKEPASIANLFVTGATGGGARYTLIAHQDFTLNADHTIAGVNNKSGFSASVFWDNVKSEYTLSIRSTEFADPIEDLGDINAGVEIAAAGWAFGQLNSLEAFWVSIKNGTAVNGQNGFTIPDATLLSNFAVSTAPINVTGYSLGANLAQAFTELHLEAAGNTYFFNGIGTGIAQGGLSTVWSVYRAVFDNPLNVVPPLSSTDLDVQMMIDGWYNQIVNEPNATYNSLYSNPRHNLAMYAIDALVQGTLSVSDFIGNPYTAPRFPMGNAVDIWVSNYEGDSGWDTIVARGGLRHGESRRIFYETQPLIMGGISEWFDWGSGHSLALLQDSLSLMAAFEKLDPDVTEDTLGAVFLAGSGKDYDSLEKILDALGRVFGIKTEVRAATADNQYADIDLRNAFHDKLDRIVKSQTFQESIGSLTFRDLTEFTSAQMISVAQDNIAYRYALLNLDSFVLMADDALYEQHNAIGELDRYDPEARSGSLTDKWIEDRAAMLEKLIDIHIADQAELVPDTNRYMIGGPVSYVDLQLGLQLEKAAPSLEGSVLFGGDHADVLEGDSQADRLYGLGGADYLEGQGGDDYLEGGSGVDVYQYSASEAGINRNDGADRILDTDGKAILRYTYNAGSALSSEIFDTVIADASVKLSETQWQSADGRFTYTRQGADLLVTINDSAGGSIVLKGWQQGDFAIRLAEEQRSALPEAPITTRDIEGDFAPAEYTATVAVVANQQQLPPESVDWRNVVTVALNLDADHNGTADLTYYQVDDLGNYLPGAAQADRQDTLNDSAGNDRITAGGGDDTINATRGGDDFIDGGDGDDSISAGAGGDWIFGGEGNDTVLAGVGGDLIHGGAGRDVIFGDDGDDLIEGNADGTADGVSGGDIVDGGEGDDTIYANVRITIDTAIIQGRTDIGTGIRGDWLNGAEGDDYVIGHTGNDVLMGGLGSDLLAGGAGDDDLNGDDDYTASGFAWTVTGLPNPFDAWYSPITNNNVSPVTGSADVLYGGAGNDKLSGAFGDDLLYGEQGDDTMAGGNDHDVLVGGAGDDRMTGDHNAVVFNDVGTVAQGDDYLDGGAGNDWMQGEGGNDLLFGGEGNDTLIGDAAYDQDTISGDDYLAGGDGDDRLFGLGGRDVLWGGTGVDVLEGGAGKDTYIFQTGDGVETISDEDDQPTDVNGVPRLLNPDRSIILVKGISKNALTYKKGSLLLDFGNGDAIHLEGFDYISPQGKPMFDYIGFDDGSRVTYDDVLAQGFDIEGTEGNDNGQLNQPPMLVGTGVTDRMRGFGGEDILAGLAGDDTLDGGAGADHLQGGAGDDTYLMDREDTVFDTEGRNRMVFTDATTLDEIDIARTQSGAVEQFNLSIENRGFLLVDAVQPALDSIAFGDGTNLTFDALLRRRFFERQNLNGGAGDETLAGYAGDDTLNGGEGNDILLGHYGSDELSGGSGNDTLDGGAGLDLLRGGTGSDTYAVTAAGGYDTVVEDGPVTDMDVITMAAGITPSGVALRREASGDLTISILGQNTGIAVAGYFNNSRAKIEFIEFADGSTIGQNVLDALALLPITGTDLDDVLTGTAWSDTLLGLDGNDVLDGGRGNDRLEGGEGNDTYVLSRDSGADDAIDVAGTSRVHLAPFLSFEDVDANRIGDDLTLGIRGTTSRLRVEGYFTASQNWTLEDSGGQVGSIDALLVATAEQGADEFRRAAADYEAAVSANFISGYQAQGYQLTGALSLHRQSSDIQASYVDGTQRITEVWDFVNNDNDRTDVRTISMDDWDYPMPAPSVLDSDIALSKNLVISDASHIDGWMNANVQSSSQSVWASLAWQTSSLTYQAGTSQTATPIVGTDPNTGDDIYIGTLWTRSELNYATGRAQGQATQLHPGQSFSVPGRSQLFPDRGLVTWTQESRTQYYSDVRAGDADNEIDYGTIVDAGGGNDIVHWAEFAYGADGNDQLRGLVQLYGGAGNDILADALHQSGGSGDDRLFGNAASNELVGGAGADFMEGGAGADRYRVELADTGFDLIIDSGNSRLSDSDYGEYSSYMAWYYSSIGLFWGQDNPPLPPLPFISPNDYAALEPLYAAGVIEPDTVEFGAGIALENLSLSWGILPGGSDDAHATLDISWGADRGIRVLIPRSDQGTDWGERGRPLPVSTYIGGSLGLGIERFTFADGSALSMAEMMSLAPLAPSFDPLTNVTGSEDADDLIGTHWDEMIVGLGGADYIQGNDGDDHIDAGRGDDFVNGGGGNDTYLYRSGDGFDFVSDSAGNDSLIFAPGIAAADVRVTTDPFGGLYLVVTNSNDRIGFGGWFNGYDRVEQVEFADGTVWTAADLEARAEALPATEFSDVLTGGPLDDAIVALDGADQLFGLVGNDTLDGGLGNDYAEGNAGNDILLGGPGEDDLVGDEGNNLVVGGAGNDSITLGASDLVIGGAGNDWIGHFINGGVVAFNPGDGNDTVHVAGNLTLSIGGGVVAGDLSLAQDGADLILSVGAGDTIRLTRQGEMDAGAWPAITLQLFGSVYSYDFNAVIAEFNAQAATNPALTLLLGAILPAHLVSYSQDQGLGGAIAWQYATIGSLDGLTGAQMQSILGDVNFGIAPQTTTLALPNRMPVVAVAIADQGAVEDASFTFQVPAATFVDPDAGDTLTYSASLADGSALPEWLSFDAATRSFSGTPVNADVGTLSVRVVATDQSSAQATDTFDIVVNDSSIIGGTPGNEKFFGTAGDDHMRGLAGDDFLLALGGNDTLDGGAGLDILHGGTGDDTYLMRAGEGSDLIVDDGGAQDRIVFGAGVDAAQVQRQGNDLNGNLVLVLSGGEEITIANWFNDPVNQIEQIQFADGAIWTAAEASTLRVFGTADSETLWGSNYGEWIEGRGGDDVILASGGDDLIQGGAGADNLLGGTGNDIYLIQVSEGSDFIWDEGGTQDRIAFGAGVDVAQVQRLRTGWTGGDLRLVLADGQAVTIADWFSGPNNQIEEIQFADATVSWTVAEASTLRTFGTPGNETLWCSTYGGLVEGRGGDDVIYGYGGSDTVNGGDGADTLYGGDGNDILQGLGGNDILTDSAGNGLYDGGDGTDTLTGNANNELLIGGQGNDTLNTGTGADIVAFNAGGGQDAVNASSGADNTLTLGGGIQYAKLSFTRSGANLVLNTGGTDTVTFADWYAGTANRSVLNLQVITEAMAGFNPAGGNTLIDNKVERFNFAALASAFDAAGQVNAWSLTNALLDAHLSGSDSEALGGDLAYQYGMSGSLAGIGLTQAQEVVNAPQFGSGAQTLRSLAELQQGQIRLS